MPIAKGTGKADEWDPHGSDWEREAEALTPAQCGGPTSQRLTAQEVISAQCDRARMAAIARPRGYN